MANEIVRLFQGIVYTKGTDMRFFVQIHKVTQDRKVAYCHIVCNIRLHKTENHIVSIKVGGKKLTYGDPLSTPTVDLNTEKIHMDSVLSTPDAKYLIVDVKNFYLKNPTNKNKYCNISIELIPHEVVYKYVLNNNQIDGYRYVGVKKVMYVLCNGAVKWGGSLGVSFVALDWRLRVFGSYGIVDRTSDHLYIRNIPLSV